MTCPPGSSLFPEQETLAGDGGLHLVFTTDLQVVDREFQQTKGPPAQIRICSDHDYVRQSDAAATKNKTITKTKPQNRINTCFSTHSILTNIVT